MFIKPNHLYVQSANDEVKYDIQVFADRIEFCWIHLRGIGALENSLWAYDGDGMRVWLNALSMESPPDVSPENVKESVKISLDFYPLCESSKMIGYSVGSDRLYSCSHGQRYNHWGGIRSSHQVQFTFRFVSTCY